MLEAVVTEETSDGAGKLGREACTLMRGPCAYLPVVGNLKKHGPGTFMASKSYCVAFGGRLTRAPGTAWRAPAHSQA